MGILVLILFSSEGLLRRINKTNLNVLWKLQRLLQYMLIILMTLFPLASFLVFVCKKVGWRSLLIPLKIEGTSDNNQVACHESMASLHSKCQRILMILLTRNSLQTLYHSWKHMQLSRNKFWMANCRPSKSQPRSTLTS